MKKYKYTKILTYNQVFAMFHMRENRTPFFPQFIKLCTERPCWCPLRDTKLATGNQLKETSFFSFSTNA